MTLAEVAAQVREAMARHHDSDTVDTVCDFCKGREDALRAFEADHDFTLGTRLRAWLEQIKAYATSDRTGEMSMGPLWDSAMSTGRKEILERLESLSRGGP